MKFALRNKVPSAQKRLRVESRNIFIEKCVDVLLKIFRISHVASKVTSVYALRYLISQFYIIDG